VEVLPAALLAIAVGIFILLVLDYGAGLNFFDDDWDFLVYRRGFSADAFLLPHGEHISVIPVAVYKALLAAFGMTSTAPFRVVSTLVLAATAVLLFTFLRRRIGDWLALFAVVLMLFLGPAWTDILWPFEMSLVGSLATGIAMLLALDRGDRTGDRAACALATVSVLCSSLGMSFVLAAAVDIALRRADWRRRAYIAAIPFALYVVWYATYGYMATHHVTLHNIVTSPIYLVAGMASALQSLLGLWPAHQVEHTHPTWGWALLALALVAVAIRVHRNPRLSRGFWVVTTAGVTFWLLAGINYMPGREASHSRYQYLGAAFILMIAAELFRGSRRRPEVVWVGLAVTALALRANLGALSDGRTWLHSRSDLSRADLGAIEVARRTVDPGFAPTPDIAGNPILPLQAGPYLDAVDAFGSPADTPKELITAPEADRTWADNVLGHALPVTLAPASGVRPGGRAPTVRAANAAKVTTRGACASLPAGAARSGAVFEPAGPRTIIRLADGSPAFVQLGRFSSGVYPFTAGAVDGGSRAVLEIPPDRSAVPWHVRVSAAQALEVCAAPPSPG
jgi:hypothetical protein